VTLKPDASGAKPITLIDTNGSGARRAGARRRPKGQQWKLRLKLKLKRGRIVEPLTCANGSAKAHHKSNANSI